MPASHKYTAVDGYFIQDPATAAATATTSRIQTQPGVVAVQIPPRFGLIDESENRWAALLGMISKLNAQAEESDTSFKLIFFGRHGEGFHNVAEAKYGTVLWDEHWSKLDGDGEITWGPDPKLTHVGEGQARFANGVWRTERETANIPSPDKFYSSPMTRATRTLALTFEGIDNGKSPMILENLREIYGEHTCDKRNTKAYIREAFPLFEIEEGFTEEDELWTTERETAASAVIRAEQALNHIFNDKEANFVSVTAHGGIINAFLHLLGRPAYALPTGGVFPIVIKSVKV